MLSAGEKSERAGGIEYANQRWLTTSAVLQGIRDVLLAGAVPGDQWVTADRQIVSNICRAAIAVAGASPRAGQPSTSTGWKWNRKSPAWAARSWKPSS
ncbi:DUF4376 domain-containing protein [Laribacter hongkongensis]|uniref:DUF4376 domain-containing protein n=1 Tax=Laribacter hongkongensis TaxID=168471 RepID=UPI001EFE63D3|nr:DUF4376 domain-containing protein [Laribacter hongkongensis]MCG9084375.1 DUF4376 domain-containing protein [Laribacter hongkongensis]MCG9097801.1 DUF4376 domain-containing protein [Laribacter hongkongensis]